MVPSELRLWFEEAKTQLRTKCGRLCLFLLTIEFGFLALIWDSCSFHKWHILYNLFVLLSLFILWFRVWQLTGRCEELGGFLTRMKSDHPRFGFRSKGVESNGYSSNFPSWKGCPCVNSNGNTEQASASNWDNSSITSRKEKGLLDEFKGKEREEDEEEEEEEEWFFEDGEDEIIYLRKEIAKLRATALVELEKERWAASSAVNETLAKILELQSEKGLIEREARRYREMAEQKQMYDKEVITSLQWIILKLEAEMRDREAD